MSVRIVIATHKETQLPRDPLYIPVQVNAEVNELIPGYQPDNAGDNISVLNYRYCELTALYWAWRNLEDDYIGMCQYRRLFCTPKKKSSNDIADVLTLAEAEGICSRTNLVLPAKRNYKVQTLAQHFRSYSFAEHGDVETFGDAIVAVAPEYRGAFDTVMRRRTGHMCNMFIMRRNLLDDYCSFLFPVMNELDQRIEKDRQRILGYFAEHMLDIWAERNKIPYEERGGVFLDRQNEVLKRVGYALRLVGLMDVSDWAVGRQKAVGSVVVDDAVPDDRHNGSGSDV